MRMRKKKYLEERLRDCASVLLDTDCENKDYSKAGQEQRLFDFQELFGSNQPVRLEIGCGKGQFIVETAKRNPHISFIAVEKVPNVIVAAAEAAIREGVTNLKFMACGAEYLPTFIPQGSIELIYLNFSCPYPKKKYARHRLTHRYFLEIYKKLLTNGGQIHQKTDNMHFFEFSLEELSQSGFTLSDISLDLHSSDFPDNIVTEYEKRFSDLGQPIYRLVATVPQGNDEAQAE